MTPADRDDIAAAFAEDRARQLRSRAEYRLLPLTHGNITGPCLACGRKTQHHDGYCSHHREQARRKP